MENQNVAPGDYADVEPTAGMELEEEIFTEELQKDAEINKEEKPADDSAALEEDKKTGEDKDKSESLEDDDTPEGEESSEEETPEDEDPKDEEDEEDDEEPKSESLKIGNLEFKTVDEAVREANRIIGHNANLAGDNKRLLADNEAKQAEIDELKEANKEWEEWSKDPDNIKHPVVDPDKIAAKAADEIEKRQELKKQAEIIKEEHDEVKSYQNFNEVSDKFYELIKLKTADPLTGKPFTSPKRLYSYLTKEFGLVDFTNKSSAPAKTKSTNKTEMQKIASKPAQSNKSSAPAIKEEDAVDWVDAVLDDQL